MRNLTEQNLTDAVLAKLEGASDARFKQIMESLVKHLHAFVREVQLTEAEWFTGIQFLTAVGQKCDDKRQEFILLSDTLGVSMLVDAINHRKPTGATESTVLGPFYVPGAPEVPSGANIAEGVQGEPTYFSGRVLTPGGKPVAGATLDLWSTDGEGWYDVQLKDAAGMRARGKVNTDAEGRYAFWTIKPVSYPIPTDGPVGKMLTEDGSAPVPPGAHAHDRLGAGVRAGDHAPVRRGRSLPRLRCGVRREELAGGELRAPRAGRRAGWQAHGPALLHGPARLRVGVRLRHAAP